MLPPRELASTLAALRHWQRTQAGRDSGQLIADWPQFADQAPLSPIEIDDFCERLYVPCGCEAPGPFGCGLPGVLARVVDCRIDPASVERCDECGRFPSDEAARQHLLELGYLSVSQ